MPCSGTACPSCAERCPCHHACGQGTFPWDLFLCLVAMCIPPSLFIWLYASSVKFIETVDVIEMLLY